MRSKKIIIIGTLALLILSLGTAPAFAGGFHHGGGGLLLGFGAGLATGYLFGPRPVYVAPPVYYPAPVVVTPSYQYYYAPGYYPPAQSYYPPAEPQVALPPQQPQAQGYAQNQNPPVPPPQDGKCHEWKMLERRTENRWDNYSGKWESVPVEKWGWVEVPCR